jgi:hypothetical protein
MPAFLTGESVARLLQGAAAGAIATIIVGFAWGGWTLGSTANEMADERASAALMQVLVPTCVQRFQQQADMPAQWAAFKDVSSWQRDAFIAKSGFATPTGSEVANREVADKCASTLSEILDKKAKEATKS